MLKPSKTRDRGRRRLLHPCTRRRHEAGLSTVELLVGVTVGLFIVGAALLLSLTLTRENRLLLIEARLMQDMRSAMDLVTREMRRSGYWANAQKGSWFYGATSITTPYGATGYAAITPTASMASEVTYAYSKDANDVADAGDVFGFRLSNNVLQMNVGNSNFQALTDPSATKITKFEVTPVNTAKQTISLSCPKACPSGSTTCPPQLQIREFVILLEGQAVGTGADIVQRTLRSEVRVRNDLATGACP